jgi:hypothetical protein
VALVIDVLSPRAGDPPGGPSRTIAPRDRACCNARLRGGLRNVNLRIESLETYLSKSPNPLIGESKITAMIAELLLLSGLAGSAAAAAWLWHHALRESRSTNFRLSEFRAKFELQNESVDRVAEDVYSAA